MIEKFKQLLNVKNKMGNSADIEERFNELFNHFDDSSLSVVFGEDFCIYGENVKEWIWDLRDNIKEETGFILPLVKVICDKELQENEVVIKVKEEITEEEYLVPTKDEFKNSVEKLLRRVCKEHLQEIFSTELAEKYITSVQKNNSFLVWNITNILSVVDIRIILTELLAYGKSIRNINYVFEKIGEQILADGSYRKYEKNYKPQEIARSLIHNL